MFCLRIMYLSATIHPFIQRRAPSLSQFEGGGLPFLYSKGGSLASLYVKKDLFPFFVCMRGPFHSFIPRWTLYPFIRRKTTSLSVLKDGSLPFMHSKEGHFSFSMVARDPPLNGMDPQPLQIKNEKVPSFE